MWTKKLSVVNSSDAYWHIIENYKLVDELACALVSFKRPTQIIAIFTCVRVTPNASSRRVLSRMS